MNFTVDWSLNALSALALIWMGAPNRSAVNAAQAEIDRVLAANPLANTTHLSEGLYAIEVYPLRALFEVFSAERYVRVVSVGELL